MIYKEGWFNNGENLMDKDCIAEWYKKHYPHDCLKCKHFFPCPISCFGGFEQIACESKDIEWKKNGVK